MNELVIDIQKLSTQFGDFVVHENLNLQIRRGECLAIVGGSGSGKTTLLREMLMLQPLTAGKIVMLGFDVAAASLNDEITLRKRCGMMFQQGALFGDITVLDNIAFPLVQFTDLNHSFIEEIARLKLALVGLSQDTALKMPAELSGGMIKRVALARAIALEPELLFLDEPTAGLDPQGADGLDDLILQLRDDLGLTVVLVTHDMDTLWKVPDRVAFLGKKKVLCVASMLELQRTEEPEIREFFSGLRCGRRA